MSLEIEAMANNLGNVKHGGCGTLTYSRWKSMMARCYQVKGTNYKYYGAIGIKVCERWHDYALFLNDMGECPDKTMTLDRINNDLNYEPNNCRWVTQAKQNANRSHCVMITHKGITKNITDWAIELGIRPQTLTMRVSQLGWSHEKALTTPVKKRFVR
jgi:hypothetical protein